MKPVSRASNALASALEQRQRAAARWRELALDSGRVDSSLAATLARVSASEQQHAEQLARELPMIDGEELLRIVDAGAESDEPGPDAARSAGASVRPAGRIARALEDALRQERRLRAVFEQLAARAPDDEVKVRALALALAETRRLRALEEAVASLRCKL
jgi:rubrerythrin